VWIEDCRPVVGVLNSDDGDVRHATFIQRDAIRPYDV
jgi:hypothetical protein